MNRRATRLKRLCSLQPEYGLGEAAANYTSEGVRLIRTTDISDDGSLAPDEDGVFLDPDVARAAMLESGDILISRSGSVGRSLLYDLDRHGPACFAGYLVRFRPANGIDPRYLYYWTKSAAFRHQVRELAIQSTIANVNGQKYANMVLPEPATDGGREVGTFLDHETRRLDTLMRTNETLRHLLWERRRAVVSHTIFSTSGRLTTVKRVTECLDGRRIPVNSSDRSLRRGAIPYYGANGVVDHIDDWLFDEPLVLLGEDGAPFFEPRDVAWCVAGRVWVNNHAHVLRPVGCDPRFLAYTLNATDYGRYITGSTRDKLTQEDMGRIGFPDLRLDAQRRIADDLDSATGKIDVLILKLDDQLALLAEHREALITAAVTGEIDVTTRTPTIFTEVGEST